MVTTGEAVGPDAAKTPPNLRRRKRACSRRQGDRERERDGGGLGSGERGDRGVGEDRDRREASKCPILSICCYCLPALCGVAVGLSDMTKTYQVSSCVCLELYITVYYSTLQEALLCSTSSTSTNSNIMSLL